MGEYLYIALRFIFKDADSDYKQFLKKSGITNLGNRRLQDMVLILFKCLYLDNYPSYLKRIFSFRSFSYSLRVSNILTLPKPSTTSYGINSFSYLACKLWNSLPDTHRKINCYNDFKRLVRNYNFM